MFNSAILEVATGIVFIYALLSLMCTALREGVEGFMKTRASYLESAIRELLYDAGRKSLAKDFYEHPLIYSLYPGNYTPGTSPKVAGPLTRGKRLPSYIPAANFATALVDIIARGPAPTNGSNRKLSDGKEHPNADLATPITMADVRKHIGTIDNRPVERAVLAALDTANGDLEKAKKNLEHWYDSAMDRVSGRYKRSTQLVLWIIGFVIAVGFNVDTITLADYLYRNGTQRGAIVAQAESMSRDKSGRPDSYEEVKKQINALQLPIGWDFLFKQNSEENAGNGTIEREALSECRRSDTLLNCLTPFWNEWHVWFMKPLGWLLTAFAVTLGAPFWFDILNKIMIIRSTVKPHEKSPEEASEDRQANGGSVRAVPASTPATNQIVQFGQPVPESAPDTTTDNNQDCCDVTSTDAEATPDNELPAAQGGVL
jgi:hypothetical protein